MTFKLLVWAQTVDLIHLLSNPITLVILCVVSTFILTWKEILQTYNCPDLKITTAHSSVETYLQGKIVAHDCFFWCIRLTERSLTHILLHWWVNWKQELHLSDHITQTVQPNHLAKSGFYKGGPGGVLQQKTLKSWCLKARYLAIPYDNICQEYSVNWSWETKMIL